MLHIGDKVSPILSTDKLHVGWLYTVRFCDEKNILLDGVEGWIEEHALTKMPKFAVNDIVEYKNEKITIEVVANAASEFGEFKYTTHSFNGKSIFYEKGLKLIKSTEFKIGQQVKFRKDHSKYILASFGKADFDKVYTITDKQISKYDYCWYYKIGEHTFWYKIDFLQVLTNINVIQSIHMALEKICT